MKNRPVFVAILATLALIMLAVLPAVAAQPGPPPFNHSADPSVAAGPQAKELDPEAWATAVPLPSARWGAAGATATGCTLFSIGGWTGSQDLADVDVYDPLRGIWAPRAPLPQPLDGIQAASIGNLIYVVGGYTRPNINHTLYIYDTLANSWSTGAPIPNPGGIAAAAVAAYGGKVYVIGGDDGDASSNTTNYEYDPATNTWAIKAPMPTGRENAVAVTLNDKIYVAGGVQAQDPNLNGLRTFEAYDPVADTWTVLADMIQPRIAPGIGTNGVYIYVYGGATTYGSGYTALASTERYDPATDTWSRSDPLVEASDGMAAAYVTGKLWAAGGQSELGVIATNQYRHVGPCNCEPTAVKLARFEGQSESSGPPLWLLAGGAAALGLGRWLQRRRTRDL